MNIRSFLRAAFLFGLLVVPFSVRSEPLQVYILCGQSNMQGHARIHTIEHVGMDPATLPLMQAMVDEQGNPRVCERVWISYLSRDLEKSGPLTAGFGADEGKIGPEFTFGITMEDNLGKPVLIIKTAWGGKSLHTDFRPPSAGPYVFSEQQIENLKKRDKDVEQVKAEKEAATGHHYRLTIEHVKKVLEDPGKVVPGYKESDGYELAGFVWFQGWNDMVDSGTYPDRGNPGGYDTYSEVMAHFIRDLRKDLSAPDMPFVIGVMGVGGPVSEYGPDRQRHAATHQNFRDAMAAPAKLPEFQGNVIPVLTENYWDTQLQALTSRDEKVKQAARKVQNEKQLKGQAAQAVLEEMRSEEFTEEEREIMAKGISNQAYHYLGSGKILGGIGRAFAQALLGSNAEASAGGRRGDGAGQEMAEASEAERTWTQVATGKQLQGALVSVVEENGKEVIRVRAKGRTLAIPLSMLTAEDQEFVKTWREGQYMRAAFRIPTSAELADLSFDSIPDGIPDFTKGAKIPDNSPHDWNLGPTGARGWIYSNKLETSEARQILITEVEEGSPAEGLIKKGDVILGVGEEPFSYDPRTELGKAISLAEAETGALPLIRWRNGELEVATIELPVLGGYAATAPFDCEKSNLILQNGFEALAEAMKDNPEEGNPIVRSYNALALLASGNPDYLPIVRDQVERFRDYSDPDRRSYHSWFYGPITILVAEYTIATGDEEFLPDLERLAREIALGQSAVGSWGHRFIQDNGILSGYGMMNAPGLPLTIALALAREAGVDDSSVDNALDRSTRLVRFYVGKGSIPYGDHRPWTQTHDDNGKNGAAAVLFNIVGEKEPAEFFSHMGTASHGAEREMGHTGNFFNLLWSMPSVALSGPNASGAWMEEYGWYFDLARRWDGTFRHQGPPQQKADSYRNWNSTGPYLLSYAQSLRKIHLTGKKRGIVEQIDKEKAASLIADGQGWSPRFKNEPYSDRDEASLLQSLRSWSPIVRERAAIALGKGESIPVDKLVSMLEEEDLHTRIGACQALAMGKAKAAPAVEGLRAVLQADNIWLRIEAAEALAAIGPGAMPAVPDLLNLLATHDTELDPRGMQQRYLCFALFDRRNGLLRGSLDGVDREALFAAVRTGLANEDGRARGAIGTVYKNLSYEEIRPLLPAIVDAVAAPAPSGIMFADGIRLSGLELLAQNHHAEGLEHFVDVLGVDRWGRGNRLPRCLKILQSYGGAAESLLPQLEEMEKQLLADRNPKQAEIELLRETMNVIRTDRNPPELRTVEG